MQSYAGDKQFGCRAINLGETLGIESSNNG